MDGGDSLVAGGHQVLRTAGATQHAKRLQEVPVWANDDVKVQAILDHSFPKWRTNTIQRARAAVWAFIITHYFRMGETSGSIAEALKLKDSTVRYRILCIKRAANGLRTKTGKPRGKRGRPKNSPTIETPM
jgi:hypothetical protein